MVNQEPSKQTTGRRIAVRRIANGCRKNIGKFPSSKNGRAVWYESLLERDFIFLLEIDTDVVAYKEQPTTIRFRAGDSIYTYTPDFLIMRQKKRQVIEVKPDKKVKEERYQVLFQHAREIFRKSGYEFLVVTEERYVGNPSLTTSNFSINTRALLFPV